ncbi:MAG: hypothetical protein HHJ12_13695 [Glaciimonas sp.]|nr:hypothetical protein [Glaciimonas sp.]
MANAAEASLEPGWMEAAGGGWFSAPGHGRASEATAPISSAIVELGMRFFLT